MDFVAIDFETANEKRSSPCSLGITVIRGNQVMEEKYWLIRPRENRFAPINIMIHGIRPADVEHEPEFDQLWPSILPYLKHRLVIAHNAAFDFSVLRSTLDLYGIDYPELDYCCTMNMSKHFYSFLDNSKLNTVNQFLGYEFSHHHASADATACANILLQIADELQTDSIEVIADKTGVKLGKLIPGGSYLPAGTKKSWITSSRNNCSNHKKRPFLTTDYFRGKHVAFTGPLKTLSRPEAMQMVASVGGSISSTVSRKTNILVTNVRNVHELSPPQMSTKLRKAMELREKGFVIEILEEAVFLELLNTL